MEYNVTIKKFGLEIQSQGQFCGDPFFSTDLRELKHACGNRDATFLSTVHCF